MRPEDIVGVSFFALLLPGIVVTIFGCNKALAPKPAAFRRGCGLLVTGVALFAFGLATFALIHTSARPVIEGNLWNVRELFGRNQHSTRFMITGPDGKAIELNCRYTGPGLREGERARVRYVAYNQKLLELDMLDGPFQDWNLREASGENGCWGWVLIGLACGFFGSRELAKSRRAEEAITQATAR